MTGLMIKAAVLTIMFKAMAVMTSISVLMSLLSLILSSIIGFSKHALFHVQPLYKIFHIGANAKGQDAGVEEPPTHMDEETFY